MLNYKLNYKILVYPKISQFWFVDIDFYDRENNCLIEYYSIGSKFWYKYGSFHRKDGPAIECSDGTKFWFLNGSRHREDGPAIEFSDGFKYWYLNGKILSEKEIKECYKKNR